MAYLYYLPFTTVFVSGDRFHRRMAPLFISGRAVVSLLGTFKAAVGEIDDYESQLVADGFFSRPVRDGTGRAVGGRRPGLSKRGQ
jgi:hypothetical protein